MSNCSISLNMISSLLLQLALKEVSSHVDVTRSDLIPFVTRRFRDARPYMAWLAAAVGLPF